MRLVIEAVSKRYRGGVWGLRGFSLQVGPGVLGLLGPNGAGKSTLMRILATVTRPTEGRVTWDGIDLRRRPNVVREVLGYLPQDFGIYPHLSAVEFLEYLAAVKGVPARVSRRRIPELLALVRLTEVQRRPLGGYSGGMRQRLGIAQALLNDPQLLIVDEPTAGLDPEERVRFRNLLAELSGDRVVILSTHIVSDVEAAAGTIAIIDEGRLVVCVSVPELLAQVAGRVWEWPVPDAELAAAKERYITTGSLRREGAVQLRVIADTPPSPSAQPVAPTLEDAYLSLLGAPAEEVA